MRLLRFTPIWTQANDGFIIVAVLWVLGALAALVSIYAIYVANTAMSLTVNDERLKAEAMVAGALELTAYGLTAANDDLRPTQGAFAYRAASANVAVRFRSEAARIDLNAAPKELLAGLFIALGASADNAGYYADRIIGWRTKVAAEDRNDEAEVYRNAGLNYLPRQAPFPDANELWLVVGLPPALVARALPLVTVFSGRPSVNVFDASPDVLAALPGMTSDRLYAILNQRGTAPQNAQLVLGLLGPAAESATSEGSRAIRVTVQIRYDGGRQIGAEAVILPLDEPTEPYRILYWHHDFDGPG